MKMPILHQRKLTAAIKTNLENRLQNEARQAPKAKKKARLITNDMDSPSRGSATLTWYLLALEAPCLIILILAVST
ncbi:hypothetical protein DI392_19190 [Vibrio albus]|uniref:Uncharacterized protein n=1 Tax=Vibrio albus TaxID=2200953 RepID=A0A2U3B4T8_9VIBR|nr:hypothetical protein DI392_19190 [Vibrio albus]